MPGKIRLVLSEEESARVRAIMKRVHISPLDRLWDHAPVLLVLHMLLQLPALLLTAAVIWMLLLPNNVVTQQVRALFAGKPNTTQTSAVPSNPPATGTSLGSTGCQLSSSSPGKAPTAFGAILAANPGSILGIDVSADQGLVDWARLKAAGVGFAFIKASESVNLTDPCFHRNWTGSQMAGIPHGAYHVFSSSSTGQRQAEYFLSVLRSESAGDLPAALDLESPLLAGEDLSMSRDEIVDWMQAVQTQSQTAPLIYGSLSVFSGYFAQYPPFQNPIWLAEYTNGPANVPQSWPVWKFWQFSPSGTVDGITGAVDLSRFNGTAQSFAQILRKPSS